CKKLVLWQPAIKPICLAPWRSIGPKNPPHHSGDQALVTRSSRPSRSRKVTTSSSILIRRLASNRARALLSASAVVPSRAARSFLRRGEVLAVVGGAGGAGLAVAEEVSEGCSIGKAAHRTPRLSEVDARARLVWAIGSVRVGNLRVAIFG